jgi:hypothetical protein
MTVIGHNFSGSRCDYWRCQEANGYQCAECGHYMADNQIRMDDDSESRCRATMGHERAVERAIWAKRS